MFQFISFSLFLALISVQLRAEDLVSDQLFFESNLECIWTPGFIKEIRSFPDPRDGRPRLGVVAVVNGHEIGNSFLPRGVDYNRNGQDLLEMLLIARECIKVAPREIPCYVCINHPFGIARIRPPGVQADIGSRLRF